MAKKIIIAGGGTGGHIFPAIAIANAIKKMAPDTEFLFVGAKGKMEMEKVPEAGYRIMGITIAGLNRSSWHKNISLPFKLFKSYFEVKSIFKYFPPDAVIGVGGYSTLPVLRTAQLRGIPTFIHESNSFAGKANVWLGKKATKIFVATDGMQPFFPKEKIMVTGNPVRSEIASSEISRQEGLSYFGLEENKTTLLVMGGSLGAKSINDAIAHQLETFKDQGLQLIWQTGKTNAAQYQHKAEGFKQVWVSPFIRDMQLAYAAADLVISRSGAMAVTEICVTGKPAIFVPFPFAAEDHQTYNAMQLVNHDAAILVKDGDAKKDLVQTAIKLSNDTETMKRFSANCKRLAIKNADQIIATEILKHLS